MGMTRSKVQCPKSVRRKLTLILEMTLEFAFDIGHWTLDIGLVDG